MLKSSTLALALLILTAHSAAAQYRTQLTIVQSCLSAVQNSDLETAKTDAEQIKPWRFVKEKEVQRGGAECLTSATGQEWVYSTISKEFQTAEQYQKDKSNRASDRNERLSDQTRRAEEYDRIERQKAERIEAMKETRAVCDALFAKDSAAALLNVVCNRIYQSSGLPQTTH